MAVIVGVDLLHGFFPRKDTEDYREYHSYQFRTDE